MSNGFWGGSNPASSTINSIQVNAPWNGGVRTRDGSPHTEEKLRTRKLVQ